MDPIENSTYESIKNLAYKVISVYYCPGDVEQISKSKVF